MFVWGLFSGDSGDFRVRGGEGALSTIGRGSSGGFEAHPGTPVPSAPYSPSLLRLKVSVPGIVGVDKGEHRTWGFERNDPGRIREVGYGP